METTGITKINSLMSWEVLPKAGKKLKIKSVTYSLAVIDVTKDCPLLGQWTVEMIRFGKEYHPLCLRSPSGDVTYPTNDNRPRNRAFKAMLIDAMIQAGFKVFEADLIDIGLKPQPELADQPQGANQA